MTENLEAVVRDLNGEEWPVVLKGVKNLTALVERDQTLAEVVVKENIADICIRLNSDREQIKSNTVILLERLLQLTPPTDQLLCHVTAGLCRRLGAANIEEPCEEVRLQMVTLLHRLVQSCAQYSTILFPYFTSIKQILVKTLTDPFSDVRRVSCETVTSLTRVLCRDFHMESEGFIKPILLSFQHNNNKIRVAAISCIGSVVMNGNASCFDMCVIPLAELLFDSNPNVRLEVARQVGNWMLNYQHRYSYWYKLLPLLLTCLNDYYPNVREEAQNLWNGVGLKYIKENEDDLKDQLNFANSPPMHYPSYIVNRPNLGCRIIVEQNIGKILPAISRELQGWQSDIRLRSAQLLINLILGAEFSLLQHVDLVIVCLLQGIRDDDQRIVEQIYISSELLGYFVEPRIWWKFLSPNIDEWTALTVISYIIKGTKEESLNTKYLKKIMNKISDIDVYKTRNMKYQNGLMVVTKNLLRICNNDCKSVAQEIFSIVYTIHCINSNENLSNEALDILRELESIAECEKGSGLFGLYEQYIRGVLINITSAINTWNEHSIDLAIISCCLTEVGPALGSNLALLSPILTEALTQNDVDPEVKIKVFNALSVMLLSKETSFSLSDSEHLAAFLKIVVEEIIFPNLVWSAGRTAEAVRVSATCCLCALLEESPNSLLGNKFSDVIFAILQEKLDKLFPLMITLVEDNSKLTRQYALRAIYYATKITSDSSFTNEYLHKTYPVVLKRLDDSNQKVRLAAIETLCLLFSSRKIPYDLVMFEAHIDSLYSTMLIHLDDPNDEVTTNIKDALSKLSDIHPNLLDKKIKANMPVFTNKCALLELEENLNKLVIVTDPEKDKLNTTPAVSV